jgi:cold shock CspA family protein
VNRPSRRSHKAGRGPITKILKKLGGGFVMADAGDEIFFGSYSLDGAGIDELEEGQLVEFELELYDLEMAGRCEGSPSRGRSKMAAQIKIPQFASVVESLHILANACHNQVETRLAFCGNILMGVFLWL